MIPGPRIAIERVYPDLEGGRYAVKRVVGERLDVWADIVRDGHDVLRANLLYQAEGAEHWHHVPMRLFENDRWTGSIVLTENRRHLYTIEAWMDPFASWRDRMLRKRAAGQDVTPDLDEGRTLIAAAFAQAGQALAPPDASIDTLLSDALAEAMREAGPREDVTRLAQAARGVRRP